MQDAAFGAGAQATYYGDCSFDRSRIEAGTGDFARFERCSFRDVELRGWFTFAVEMVDCIFTGTLQRCVFNGTVPPRDRPFVKRARNEFHGNDFREADLIDVGFRTGIDLRQQLLPSTSGYAFIFDAETAIHRAERTLGSWAESTNRAKSLRLLQTIKRELAGGQKQLLLRRGTYRRVYDARIEDTIFELLCKPTNEH